MQIHRNRFSPRSTVLPANVSGSVVIISLEQREITSFCGEARIVSFARQRLNGAHQAHNLAGVVAGLSLLLPLDDYSAEQLRTGFHGTHIAGRLQELQSRLACRLMVDVGHNQDAARVLAASMAQLRQEEGRVVVLLGMLEDKQPDLFVEALKPAVDAWWVMTLDSERGLDAAALTQRVAAQVEVEQSFEQVEEALDHALSSLTNQDIMLVTGSFVTVELLLRALSDSGEFN